MPIKIINSDIFSSRFATGATNFLKGVVGEIMQAKFSLSISKIAKANNDYVFIFAPENEGFINHEQIIYCENPVFNDFNSGDRITIEDTVNNNTLTYDKDNNATYLLIKEKINEFTIRLSKGDGTDVTLIAETFNEGLTTIIGSQTALLICQTAISNLKYRWNLIENEGAESYKSLIDNSELSFSMATGDALDCNELTTIYHLNFDSSIKSSNYGDVTIQGAGQNTNSPYEQYFTLTHTFLILPYLPGQIGAILNKDVSEIDYFNDLKCLKYICEIKGNSNSQDPNNLNELTFGEEIKGNTGWFNENFNAKTTPYEITAINYDFQIPNSTQKALKLKASVNTQQTNTLRIYLRNLSTANFISGETKIDLGFLLLLSQADLDKNITYNDNFVNDHCLLTLGDTSYIAGENFGSKNQIFSSAKAIYINHYEMYIDITIATNNELNDRIITKLQNKAYVIYAIIQDSDKQQEAADNNRVSLIVDTNYFDIDYTIPYFVTFKNRLIPHNDVEEVAVAGAITCFPGDEVILKSDIKIKNTLSFFAQNNIEIEDIDFDKILIEIKAIKGDNNFILENFEYSFKNDIKKNGYPITNFNKERVFLLPTNSSRKNIKITTIGQLGEDYIYKVSYPFLFRWEYWEKLKNADAYFFDVDYPYNGQNEFWHRYNEINFNLFLESWRIYIRTTVQMKYKGNEIRYYTDNPLNSNDYNANGNWYDEYLNSYNLAGAEMKVGENKFIQSFEKTKIYFHAKNKKVFNKNNIVVEITGEVFEKGGIAGRYRISSAYDVGSEAIFTSIDSSNRVKMTFIEGVDEDGVVGDIEVIGECYVDNKKIPTNIEKITIYGRIYDDFASGIILMNNNLILLNNLQGLIFLVR